MPSYRRQGGGITIFPLNLPRSKRHSSVVGKHLHTAAVVWPMSDPDAGGLAGSAVQRHVDDVAMVGSVLRRADDVRQLRPVQPACRHLGRRILSRRRRQ